MDRRGFFRHSAQKSVQKAVETVDARARARAKNWIRPPFARAELEFLLTCTRCGACVDACPHNVVFTLTAKLGAEVVGTPALDLINKACLLCDTWPCVLACEPKALVVPDPDPGETEALPVLATMSIDAGRCLPYLGPECGACEDSCPLEGVLLWAANKPHIDLSLCVGCGQCRQACILSPSAIQVGSIT